MKVAIIGVTGLVGKALVQLLEKRDFPVSELYPVASSGSAGGKVFFGSRQFKIIEIKDALNFKPDLALFSAGSEISKKFAPRFSMMGTYVVDNSSAWRADPAIKLIIPEVNGNILECSDFIIANPNCSTIQLLMVIHPLHQKYRVKRIVVSTYQSVTGSGLKAVAQMENERMGIEAEQVYPHPIDKNCIPHIDEFGNNAYTREEMKMENETVKILNDNRVKLTATAVRVPVIGGHSESVNIEFETSYQINDVRYLLKNSPGLKVLDEPENNIYPMPLISKDRDEVFVGRIRKDNSRENCLNLWIVADNLRKGAATNTIQIAEELLKKGFLKAD